jgi:uncharacterized protein YecE (DUF72 family)
MGQLFAGTSGFAYTQWKPRFYPQDVPHKKFLEHYAKRLNAVEINYTFRRTPSAATLESWAKATPEGFSFSIKAHQRITHIARLKDAREQTEFFLNSIDPLRTAQRLGVVLFQLPPYLRCDVALLADFLAILPGGLRYTFEFRHASWQTDAVYRLLEGHNVSYCLAESENLEPPDVITADFVYFRLRKPEYTVEDRQVIWAKTNDLLESGKSVFLFFKHEDTPEGALYAEEMLRKAGPDFR